LLRELDSALPKPRVVENNGEDGEQEETRVKDSVEVLLAFIHKLVGLEAIQFRAKCNQYLFMICCSFMYGNHDKLKTLIESLHKEGQKKKKSANKRGETPAPKTKIHDDDGMPLSISVALEPEKLPLKKEIMEWENANFWENRLKIMIETNRMVTNLRIPVTSRDTRKCSIHPKNCPDQDVQKKIGECLDNQFKYLLYLCETYQAATSCDKEQINLWMTALCKIENSACLEMKGIRNDYAMLMAGYLTNNELKGPFEDMPTSCLPPLTQAIATQISKRKGAQKKTEQANYRVPLNPASETVEAFMNQVPKIHEGAFALLSINGSLFNQ
jgi:hypothetical protein